MAIPPVFDGSRSRSAWREPWRRRASWQLRAVHRSTLCDNLSCRGGDWADVQGSADSSKVAFVSTSRDHRNTSLRLADATSGEVRDVLDETVLWQGGLAGRV